MFKFCGVISGNSHEATFDENKLIDFQCMRRIHRRIELETKEMLLSFKRQHYCVNKNDSLIYNNEQNLESAIKNLYNLDHVLQKIELEVAYNEMKLNAMERDVNHLEQYMSMREAIRISATGDIPKCNQEIRQFERWAENLKTYMQDLQKQYEAILATQAEMDKDEETTAMLKTFLDRHLSGMQNLENILNKVEEKMRETGQKIFETMDLRDESATALAEPPCTC